MLAQGNYFIQEAAQTMYQLSAKESIRQQCEALEDAERVMQGILEKQERETARADAAEAEAETARAKAASAEARAIAAETKLTAVLEELKCMREEIDALKQRP